MDDVPAARRSALFVDFDNIYSGLKALDRAAAESFATDPQTWLDWLARPADVPTAPPRRFLLQLCYLNPNVYSRYRVFFMRSGFKVVDCPPLTAQGKTSADIHIVLDVLDALAHETRYDEFVIASADADFTPLLFRLRSHDRRTTVLTGGPASAAYRAVCDSVILPDEFADAVGSGIRATNASESGAVDAPKPTPRESHQDRVALVTAAADAVRRAVAAAPTPLVSASAAHAARAAYPDISSEGWAGAGSFSAFVARHAPDLAWARHPSPGYLYDPGRHSVEDLPGGGSSLAALHSVAEQTCRVTGTPRLTREQYGVLFEELAHDVVEQPFSLTETSKSVRDRTADRGTPVSRGAVNFVLQGLIYSGNGPTSASSAGQLAEAFAENVRVLCRNAQMELDDEDARTLRDWLTGGVADRTAPAGELGAQGGG